MNKVLIYIVSFIIIGCKTNNEKNEVFVLPTLINSQDNDTLERTNFTAKYVSQVFPEFVGKFKFKSNIDINPLKRDTSMYRDFIWSYSRVEIDDSLDVNGFDLVVDYETTVFYNQDVTHGFSNTLFSYYPVYFVNSSNSDKIFLGKDSYAYGIQEARMNEQFSDWQPIEGRGFDFCGNGTFGLVVRPKEFVIVLMKKYEGNYKAPLRVRFQQDESIYVSKPFYGYIDTNQFTIQDSTYLSRRLQETNGKAATWLFYGAVPKEEEWVVKTIN